MSAISGNIRVTFERNIAHLLVYPLPPSSAPSPFRPHHSSHIWNPSESDFPLLRKPDIDSPSSSPATGKSAAPFLYKSHTSSSSPRSLIRFQSMSCIQQSARPSPNASLQSTTPERRDLRQLRYRLLVVEHVVDLPLHHSRKLQIDSRINHLDYDQLHHLRKLLRNLGNHRNHLHRRGIDRMHLDRNQVVERRNRIYRMLSVCCRRRGSTNNIQMGQNDV